MADSDYTVAVVLQASDEGMSTTLKGAADGIEDTSKKAKEAQINFMAMVVGFEALTSGLNQFTGGLRKMSAALKETGRFTEEETQAMNKQIATIELITGPMETLIAVQKILTVVTSAAAMGKTADAEAGIIASTANYIYGLSIYFVLGSLIIIVAILALLYLAWQNQETVLNGLNATLAITAGYFAYVAKEARDATEAVMDFAESIVNSIPGGSGTDPSPVIVSGLGG